MYESAQCALCMSGLLNTIAACQLKKSLGFVCMSGVHRADWAVGTVCSQKCPLASSKGLNVINAIQL